MRRILSLILRCHWPLAQNVRLMEDHRLNNFLRTHYYFPKTLSDSRSLLEEEDEETESEPTVVVIFLLNHAACWLDDVTTGSR